MFNYSIRNDLTRKYYERRLKKFFDHIGVNEQLDIGERCNCFAKKVAHTVTIDKGRDATLKIMHMTDLMIKLIEAR